MGARCPAIVRLWDNAWAEFVPFLAFDPEIRQVICSTNALESVNARIRRAVKARGHFCRRTGSAEMCLHGDHEPGPDRHRPKTLDHAGKPALNAFEIAFDGRLAAGRR